MITCNSRTQICLFLLVLTTGCSNSLAQSTKTGVPPESNAKSERSIVQLLSEPRFAVFSLTEDAESQSELRRVLNRENFKQVIEELSTESDRSLPARNALSVARSHALLWEFENYRDRTDGQARTEQRQVSPEELDQGLLEHVRRLRHLASEFQRVAQAGEPNAKINFYSMLQIIGIANQSMPTWNNSVGEGVSVEELSSVKQQLRHEVIELLKFLEYAPQAKQDVTALAKDNYWPALEFEVRDLIRQQAKIDSIEDAADILSKANGLDAISNAYAASIILRIALAKGTKPPLTVLRLSKKSIELGSTSAYPVMFDYYLALDNDSKAEEILEAGSAAGQLDCIFKLACRCFARNEYGQAQKLFSEALSQGVNDATVYLGMIYENGGDGIGQDMTKAISFYEQGMAVGVPETIERLGHLYAVGVLKAEVLQLEYQIPGVPRLPEPTAQQKQLLANLNWAHLRFELAADGYRNRGDNVSLQRVTKYAQHVMHQIEGINASAFNLGSNQDLQTWRERDDRRLDRSFERQIELRNQNRRDTEERNRRYDRMYNNKY